MSLSPMIVLKRSRAERQYGWPSATSKSQSEAGESEEENRLNDSRSHAVSASVKSGASLCSATWRARRAGM